MEALKFAFTLAAELIPLFLLISTAVYLLVDRLSEARIRSLLGGRSRWIGVPLAAALGALTPFCSCSSVPLVNGMKNAKVPVAALVTFLIASPLINPVAVGLLGTTVGGRYAVLYTGAGIAFAIAAGLLVEAWYRPALEPAAAAAAPSCTASACAPAAAAPAVPAPGGSCCGSVPAPVVAALQLPFPAAARAAFGRALADLRKLWAALAAAIAVGAAIHGYVPAELLASVAGPDRPWAIPAAALLGVPVYASTIVLLPLSATLLAKGVGVGAVTAFLMGSSGFSLPEGILLSRILPRALLLRILAVFSAGVIVIGYGFQWLVG